MQILRVMPDMPADVVLIRNCNPHRIIAECQGNIGIVSFEKDEGLWKYRITWGNGNTSSWYMNINELMQSTKTVTFYQINIS
jgi:hypothetical protein